MTPRRSRAGGGVLSEPPTLAHEFWSGKQRFAADGSILCGVARERAAPLGRLPSADERPADSTVQASMGQAGWGGRN